MLVTGLPKHVICVRQHQNGSEYAEIGKKFKTRAMFLFQTFVSRSGSKTLPL